MWKALNTWSVQLALLLTSSQVEIGKAGTSLKGWLALQLPIPAGARVPWVGAS